MLRVSASLLLGLFITTACVADEVKPLTEEARLKLVEKWTEGYEKELTRRMDAWEKAKVQNSLAPKRNGEILVRARDDVAKLKANPLLASRGLYESAKVGDVGVLASSTAVIEKVEENQTVIIVSYTRAVINGIGGFGAGNVGKGTATMNYIVADPIPKAKTAARVSLPGLYHVVRVETINKKNVPVVQRFEIKKDELPKKK